MKVCTMLAKRLGFVLFALSLTHGAYAENYNRLIAIQGGFFKTEVAATEEARSQGLMFRDSLAVDQAMLFDFKRPQPVAFWMKDTYVALDMLFFNEQKTLVEIATDMPPCRQQNCPIYYSRNQAVRYVVEIKAGQSSALGLKVGDSFSFVQ